MEPVEARVGRFAAAIAAVSRAVDLRAAGGVRGKDLKDKKNVLSWWRPCRESRICCKNIPAHWSLISSGLKKKQQTTESTSKSSISLTHLANKQACLIENIISAAHV